MPAHASHTFWFLAGYRSRPYLLTYFTEIKIKSNRLFQTTRSIKRIKERIQRDRQYNTELVQRSVIPKHNHQLQTS